MIPVEVLAWAPIVSFALASVATAAYVFGRQRSIQPLEAEQVWQELKRARSIMQELERISSGLRKDLASHQVGVLEFKENLARLGSESSTGDLNDEAERMLKPTIELSNRVAQAYDEIRHQANLLMSFTEVRTDPLTGLHNRRGLEELLRALFAMFYRYKKGFSIAVLDLDHFKKLNDEHGHLYGDQALRDFAELLNEEIRETDRAARYGGEEFVIILPETNLEGAAKLCSRICHNTAEKLGFTVSIGIASAETKDDMESLLARGDEAVYAAKDHGRNCVFWHEGKAAPVVLVSESAADGKEVDAALGTSL